jgi:hypothetical protein
MSGTAATEIDEFSNIYNMSVQVWLPPPYITPHFSIATVACTSK